MTQARSRREVTQAGSILDENTGSVLSKNQQAWSFAREEVERFLDSFAQVSPANGVEVGFDFAAEAFRRQGVDIDGLLSLVLVGGLSVAAPDPDAVGLKRLRFRRADVRAACRELDGGLMTVQSGAERLGLKWAVVDNLVRQALIVAEPEGISAAELERFRREYVVGSELAREARTSPRHMAARLAALGVRPVVGPEVDGSRQNVFRRAEVVAVQRADGGFVDHLIIVTPPC